MSSSSYNGGQVIAKSFIQNRAERHLRNSIHQIEGVIIGWSHQIHDVLKRKSAQPLLEGLNPEPMVEIDFWESRARNLECIFDQVDDSRKYCAQFKIISMSSKR